MLDSKGGKRIDVFKYLVSTVNTSPTVVGSYFRKSCEAIIFESQTASECQKKKKEAKNNQYAGQ